ncbi:MAG: SPOR domain-containing protein, partial [Pseudomonadales bacterium]|nr:SPOR domain-containing protein [Pseudomonadales bacterium]
AEQAEPQRFATYQLARDGRTLHVVVYGVFDSKAEAERAARALTGSAAKVKPWIRTLAQVHTAIRTVQRQ